MSMDFQGKSWWRAEGLESPCYTIVEVVRREGRIDMQI